MSWNRLGTDCMRNQKYSWNKTPIRNGYFNYNVAINQDNLIEICHPLELVSLQRTHVKLCLATAVLNPLRPHDALKHHFISLKTDLIFIQPRVLEREFLCNWLTNTWVIVITFPPTSNHLHPLQVENCGSNSRLVVDEDENGKFRIERVNFKWWKLLIFVFIFSFYECLSQLIPLHFNTYVMGLRVRSL